MNDRPTLWVHYDYGPDGEFSDRRASRADLLAALGAEWWCVYGDKECVPEPHADCHWAVKP